jgi:hypothetical protein
MTPESQPLVPCEFCFEPRLEVSRVSVRDGFGSRFFAMLCPRCAGIRDVGLAMGGPDERKRGVKHDPKA